VLAKVAKWVGGKVKAVLSRGLGGDPKATAQQRLDKGMEEGAAAVNRYAGKKVGALVLRPLLAVIRTKHMLTKLDVELEGERWTLVGEVNPKKRTPTLAQGTGAGDFRSKIAYFPPNSNRGASRMVADPIGPDNEDAGSVPSEAGAAPIWTKVNTRRASDKRLYVLGHLLNKGLGGPGNMVANLTPITFSMNKRHSAQIEAPLKLAIGKSKSKPNWFYYEVKVVYPSARRTLTKVDADGGVNADEGLLAASFKCNWYELEVDPDNPKKLIKKKGGRAQAKDILHEIPPYPDT